jgi:methyltransferase
MPSLMTFFFLFIFFVISQRIFELFLARRNEKILKAQGAVEFDKKGYVVIVIMHTAFFVSLIVEKLFLDRALNRYWIILIFFFFAAQILRYWAISALGTYWNTKILVLPKHKLIETGPYRYLKHPNYIAVVVEIAVIPMIFSCYITAIVFSIFNFLLLRRRVSLEESMLEEVY